MTAESTAKAPPAARHAATVVLLRENAGQLEVLLTQRAAGLVFMGGLWVFPGGRMEPTDHSAEVAQRVPETAHARLPGRLATLAGAPLDALTTLGLHVAACRETFEEAGVLLARTASGAPCDARQIERLRSHRAAATDAVGFVRMLQQEDLYLDVEPLTYWSHWITPEGESRRFDTRFFVVRVPQGQEASADRSELVQHEWVSPADALARSRADTMRMAPPTLATLADLRDSHARHGGLDAMLEAEAGRDVPPILPKFATLDEQRWVVLPWDPAYAHLPGEGCDIARPYPEHLARQPSRRRLPAGIPDR